MELSLSFCILHQCPIKQAAGFGHFSEMHFFISKKLQQKMIMLITCIRELLAYPKGSSVRMKCL